MATKLSKMGALGGMHTAGIYSDMTVDGPEIGTLVVIVDRAKNLPNRRTMGKQDPYCAARLGKEAKKTETDKRGGQTPKWDQELRFTVHDSPDYHNLKVSVFNDDKKTELIGEAWVSLENVLTPGGGQSDTWHGLNCKGKYAGEIRIELTYYDTRPKVEKTPAEKKQTARPGGAEGQSPSVSGPRESMPVKRRPLPSDPAGTSPSPAATPAEHRGLSGPQPGPRSYPTPPRQQQVPNRSNEYTPTHQRRSYHPDSHAQSVECRRPLPDASPMNHNLPTSSHNTPQNQHRAARDVGHDAYSPANNPTPPNPHTPQFNEDGFDMSYTAPKPYEVRPIDPLPSHPRDAGNRTMSQNDFRSSHGHSQSHVELQHTQSAPVVPTHHTYDPEPARRDPYPSQSDDYLAGRSPQHPDDYHQMHNSYQELPHHVEPLRPHSNHSRGIDYGNNQMTLHNPYTAENSYVESQPPYDPFSSHGRPSSSMQPTVEDEDDIPPPPPVHRSSASTVTHHHQQLPPNYHGDAPAPLNLSRYREEPSRGYDSPPQPYGMNEYSAPPSGERRYIHPRPSMSPQPTSRPESRDTMAPSPLRHETSPIPSSLVAGYDPSRPDNRMSVRADPRESGSYQSPSYEASLHQRHLSESDYRTPPQYETPPRPHPLTHQQALSSADSPSYYHHSSPQEPQRTSSFPDAAPMIKPRAVSPANTHSPVDNRMSRPPARSMPTRKSVSPRPPPSNAESSDRRLSRVPFNPDSFDVLNPTVSRNSNMDANGVTENGEDRRGSNTEVNDKGQIVTFSGRVIDASDHLPLDSWAPEPERKGPQKDRPVRERVGLNGARDIEAARQRERERKERDRIRNAVNVSIGANGSPSTALVTSRHNFGNSSPVGSGGTIVLADPDVTPGSGGRNRLQKRNQRPVSSFVTPSHTSPSNIPVPNSHVLRERENLGGYGGSPGYGAGNRHSVAAPPIPAKIPLGASDGVQSEDMTALSLELQTIDIGPGSGGRHRGTARRRYG
ncbi:hypothetical protein K469DRAFT_687179 [Zopfia rhizophila CBS 207.26]|uniref:C2 domain-containing protein n=1 Tax=Zopfia rhizophila CBS 207.26 TaxID=1314779 RepID=A0A6A6E5Y6_9PEZI|nr:hypothetical protein K469DRAFT_687179 [Zopfia rhizophila CBS 207.26]